MKSPILYSVFLLILMLSACQDEVKIDETDPQIRIITPFDNGEYKANDFFQIQMEITDDIDLKELTLRLHDNSRPHFEGSALSSIFDWDTTITMNVKGTKADLTFEVPLPENFSTSSNYHLVAMCMDKSGNQTDWVEVPFKLIVADDDTPPVISLTSSPLVSTYASDPFAVVAEINDDIKLSEILISFKDSNDSVYFENTIDEAAIGGGSSYLLQEFFTAPSTSGIYEIELNVKDAGGNQTDLKIPVRVL